MTSTDNQLADALTALSVTALVTASQLDVLALAERFDQALIEHLAELRADILLRHELAEHLERIERDLASMRTEIAAVARLAHFEGKLTALEARIPQHLPPEPSA